jgi:starch phosphorylase
LVLTQLINGTLSPNDPELFREIYESLLNGAGGRADEYFVLKDFDAYADAQEKIDAAYRDKKTWAKMEIMNTAFSGKFSSDRTIEQYAKEIWDLKSVNVKMNEEKNIVNE